MNSEVRLLEGDWIMGVHQISFLVEIYIWWEKAKNNKCIYLTLSLTLISVNYNIGLILDRRLNSVSLE